MTDTEARTLVKMIQRSHLESAVALVKSFELFKRRKNVRPVYKWDWER
jgi:hypothetical protein